jgi:hypothetical protein
MRIQNRVLNLESLMQSLSYKIMITRREATTALY